LDALLTGPDNAETLKISTKGGDSVAALVQLTGEIQKKNWLKLSISLVMMLAWHLRRTFVSKLRSWMEVSLSKDATSKIQGNKPSAGQIEVSAEDRYVCRRTGEVGGFLVYCVLECLAMYVSFP
jgi:hypothetical protein